MTFLSSKELYELFLDSEWWRRLSSDKKAEAGYRCEGCGRKWDLQSHHVRYPEHWFDTTPADLKCLCRWCHEAEHAIKPVKKKPVKGKARKRRKKSKVDRWPIYRAVRRHTMKWRNLGNSSN